MARRRRRLWQRTRSETIPLPTRLPNRPRNYLHLLDIHPGLRPLATYGLSRRLDNSSGSWEWKRIKWSWHHGDGAWVVWIRIINHRHDRTVGYDIEYQSSGRDIWLSGKVPTGEHDGRNNLIHFSEHDEAPSPLHTTNG